MNKTAWVVVAVVVVLGGAYLLMKGAPATTNTSSNTTGQNQTSGAQGRVVFSVTDAAVNMSTISEITMKVNSVDVHSDTNGWMTVSTTPRTYDLLALNAKNQSEVLVDANLKAGTYNQVRLMVDSISVKTKAGATKTAKLPSGELKINTMLVVNADTTSSVSFDFMADKSLHMTGNGGYIFAPVVKTQTKSGANVSVNGDGTVTVTGGHSDDSNTEGMDIDGSVKPDFQIKSDEKLDIVGDVINIHGVLNANVPKTSSISIKNFSFGSGTLTIKAGTKVTWTNDDSVPHTVTSDSGNLLDSGTLSPGQSFSFTFANTGTVNYHCAVHPMMKGKIIVQS